MKLHCNVKYHHTIFCNPPNSKFVLNHLVMILLHPYSPSSLLHMLTMKVLEVGLENVEMISYLFFKVDYLLYIVSCFRKIRVKSTFGFSVHHQNNFAIFVKCFFVDLIFFPTFCVIHAIFAEL